MNKEDLVLKKIKHVELKTKKLVNALVLGSYKSVMRGQGMTFSDFREYVPGDDVRNISWSLIAKTNKPYVKQYEEERDLNLYFLVDTKWSMFEGCQQYLKMEQALYATAALALAGQKSNDLSGLILYSTYMRSFVPPKKGMVHIRRLLGDIINAEPESGSANGLIDSCNLILKHQKKKSVVFIFSDFYGIEKAKIYLQSLSKKHQVVACVLSSQSEQEMNPLGGMLFRNPASQNELMLNSSSSYIKNKFADYMQTKIQKRQQILKSSGADVLELKTHEDIYAPIIKYFNAKARR